MADYYLEIERKAVDELSRLLALPIPDENNPLDCDDEFDPWRLFPCLFGSYSSAFDSMALDVLVSIRDGELGNETLAHEMFREMLCTSGLCDYGTSPRTCFPSPSFRPLLPDLIAKWKEYYSSQWKQDYCDVS